MDELPVPPPTGKAASQSVQGAPPPDAGEPQGARDDRPAMLGWRFAATLATGSLVGLVLALATHWLITSTITDSTHPNDWSWALAAIGGIAVGGACTLFIYGTATDRDDATGPKQRGQADVSERGEWRRTLSRRHRQSQRP
jgi:hypothetical protein